MNTNMHGGKTVAGGTDGGGRRRSLWKGPGLFTVLNCPQYGTPCSPPMRLDRVSVPSANLRAASFYDQFGWLYPLIDFFCAPGRGRLIAQINREPAGRLLEIGVGPGSHLRYYRGHHLTAIDCSARMVARSRRQRPDAIVRQMDGERMDFSDASFDYVTLCHVLSVTENPAAMLAEARRVLRPGGRLFVVNHETPANAWRHVEALFVPLARHLHFRPRFRIEDIDGVEGFRLRRLGVGLFGLMAAYSLEK